MNFIIYLVGILVLEALLGVFYYLITPKSIRLHKIDYKSLVKGAVERAFLTISLIHNYPHAMTLFGTLKLATRLKRDNEQDKSKEALFNDYYLIGNLISIIMAIFYVYLYKTYVFAD
jgi:hypothetical protein